MIQQKATINDIRGWHILMLVRSQQVTSLLTSVSMYALPAGAVLAQT